MVPIGIRLPETPEQTVGAEAREAVEYRGRKVGVAFEVDFEVGAR